MKISRKTQEEGHECVQGKENSTHVWEWSGRASWRWQQGSWALRMVWDETDGEWSSQVSVRVCVPSSGRSKRGRRFAEGVLGNSALQVTGWVILGNNSASQSLPSSSVQWASHQRVAVRIRQGDVGKGPDLEGVARAWLLVLVYVRI